MQYVQQPTLNLIVIASGYRCGLSTVAAAPHPRLCAGGSAADAEHEPEGRPGAPTGTRTTARDESCGVGDGRRVLAWTRTTGYTATVAAASSGTGTPGS